MKPLISICVFEQCLCVSVSILFFLLTLGVLWSVSIRRLVSLQPT